MPKLTLRDLFWLLTLAAVLMAWWVDHRRLKEENDLVWQELLDRSEAIP